jgi:uncharacterized protein YxjI
LQPPNLQPFNLKTMNYPLTLTFRIFALGQQVKVTDATDKVVCFVKQKAFKLKEDVIIFADEAQVVQVCQIKADRILDISASYTISLPDGRPIGKLKRQGMKSLWKASYELQDTNGTQVGLIHEENPWIKVADAVVGEIPVVGLIAQRFINPAFLVDIPEGQPVLRVQKRPSLIDRRFEIQQVTPVSPEWEWLLIPSVMMAVLLERMRG